MGCGFGFRAWASGVGCAIQCLASWVTAQRLGLRVPLLKWLDPGRKVLTASPFIVFAEHESVQGFPAVGCPPLLACSHRAWHLQAQPST